MKGEAMPTLSGNELTSTSVLEADLTSDQRMLIISGIAICEYSTPANDGNVYLDEWTIKLGVFALDILQSSVTLGLADVSTQGTPFEFEASSARVSLDSSGEIVLNVLAGCAGQSTLNRFSYQVVLLVKAVTSQVRGTIKWDQTLWNLAPDAGGPPPVLAEQITVKVVKNVPPPPGSLGGSIVTVKTGHCDAYSHHTDSDSCEAQYDITGLPFGEALSVEVDVGSKFVAPPNDFVSVVQTSGPAIFTLTVNDPSRTCDFAVGAVQQPK